MSGRTNCDWLVQGHMQSGHMQSGHMSVAATH